MLTGISISPRYISAGRADFSKGAVEHGAVPRPVCMGRDGGGVNLVGQNPVQSGLAAIVKSQDVRRIEP